jgi:hypothetical protein
MPCEKSRTTTLSPARISDKESVCKFSAMNSLRGLKG